MAERSFTREVQQLTVAEGTEFHGEGILAVTKALLEAGVGYVTGYQGAPISHLMDVLSDAQPILDQLGVYFEPAASEAGAAAALSASVNYPVRGAATWKSTVGTNVASDALANLASSGVTGGTLIIVGEDYGEGSSIMQERSHAFAMKSQMWLLDPKPNLPAIVQAVHDGFALSEASHTPVMLELRIRSCHMTGSFTTRANQRPTFTLRQALEAPRRDLDRIVLPPASFLHEREKIEQRWPAAVQFITEHKLNEVIGGELEHIGIVMLGGLYNNVQRALERLDLGDRWGATRVPLYLLNVAYPLVDDEVVAFCRGKRAVLVVEEGQPDYHEQALHSILRRHGVDTAIHGKDLLPKAGDYTVQALIDGVRGFVERWHPPARAPAVSLGMPQKAAATAEPAVATPPRRSARCCRRARRACASAARSGRSSRRSTWWSRSSGRTTCRPTSAATCSRSCRRSTWAPPRWATASARRARRPSMPAAASARQARDRVHGRRRLLAQRSHLGHRQRGVQPARQRVRGGRQQLLSGHRRPGHPVVARGQPQPQHDACDRERRARRRRAMGAHGRPHL